MKDLKINVQKIEKYQKRKLEQKERDRSKQHKLEIFKYWKINESRPTNSCNHSIWDWKVNVQKTKWDQRKKLEQKEKDGSKWHKSKNFKNCK